MSSPISAQSDQEGETAVAACVDGASQVLVGEKVERDGEADSAGEAAEGEEP